MVDAVTGATSTQTTSASKTDAKKASLDYDNFLKLLITQMKNQDPTNPMDPSQQVAQLATFSQVEQSIKMNTNLESLISASSLSNASSYIGKTITSADGQTSGVVKSVEVTAEGLSATTVAGSTIAIGQGIKISQTAS
ncbi:flagellar hook assembly protein FlgD [Agrobacterium larrymoorei]|uniref:Basal-body rod modification protein FlgD n=1 Tax=Agrobacterium larrymoorei TaxID=160699 RepID=A0AAJ2BJN0_9HYPH|nr:flagellar hook assembly protein FlgD [Agrobacterium larrymoorei]MDQ1185065.1 flagellar basal-body rod modification protein FlgD [Agrobacterium larrymoorei]MDR6104211.1 flagellar basal-body rod modification protein FlgD [Agrobacterium larrymoorei]